ncbi:MAG: ribonuclease HII [Bacteroidota bacterium]
MLAFERKLWTDGFGRVMGLDEVGRGCLAGPVVAAGVILDPDGDHKEYRDSKTLSAPERERLALKVREEALYSVIIENPPTRIDEINILNASLEAMVRCSESGGEPDYLLVDGNRYPASLVPFECLVKGDNRSASIAAASILAKVYRDHLMQDLHPKYPCFGWERNVGYPTKQHREALLEFGFTEHHRHSFRLGTNRPYTKPEDSSL